MTPKDRIIAALDVDSLISAEPVIAAIAPYVGCFKVGLQLLTREGAPRVVKHLHALGGKVFFDGKFDDIPNTVGEAARAVADLGVKMFDVHACAGLEAMRAAAQNKGRSLLLAVTVLTSLDDARAQSLFGQSVRQKVRQFALESVEAGADGIICSAQDLEWLQDEPSLKDCLKVTPGIRPEWSAAGDQKRTLTPGEAIRRGATQIVVGRPLLRPPSHIGGPLEAAKRILDEVAEAAP